MLQLPRCKRFSALAISSNARCCPLYIEDAQRAAVMRTLIKINFRIVGDNNLVPKMGA